MIISSHGSSQGLRVARVPKGKKLVLLTRAGEECHFLQYNNILKISRSPWGTLNRYRYTLPRLVKTHAMHTSVMLEGGEKYLDTLVQRSPEVLNRHFFKKYEPNGLFVNGIRTPIPNDIYLSDIIKNNPHIKEFVSASCRTIPSQFNQFTTSELQKILKLKERVYKGSYNKAKQYSNRNSTDSSPSWNHKLFKQWHENDPIKSVRKEVLRRTSTPSNSMKRSVTSLSSRQTPPRHQRSLPKMNRGMTGMTNMFLNFYRQTPLSDQRSLPQTNRGMTGMRNRFLNFYRQTLPQTNGRMTNDNHRKTRLNQKRLKNLTTIQIF